MPAIDTSTSLWTDAQCQAAYDAILAPQAGDAYHFFKNSNLKVNAFKAIYCGKLIGHPVWWIATTFCMNWLECDGVERVIYPIPKTLAVTKITEGISFNQGSPWIIDSSQIIGWHLRGGLLDPSYGNGFLAIPPPVAPPPVV